MVGFKMAVTPHTRLPLVGDTHNTRPGARPADGFDKILGLCYTQIGYRVKALKPDDPPSAPPMNVAKQASSTVEATQSRVNSPDPTSNNSLVIESVVRGGDKTGGKAIACRWDNDLRQTIYLAKIYGPLYLLRSRKRRTPWHPHRRGMERRTGLQRRGCGLRGTENVRSGSGPSRHGAPP